MDNLLVSFSEKGTREKVVITVLGSIIFLIILAILYFLTTPSQNNKQSFPGEAVQPSSMPLQPIEKTSFTGKPLTYKNSYYSISYPDSYSHEEGQIPGGGTSLILKPQTQDSLNTVIEIQTYDALVASQSAVENVFSALGYQRNQTTVFNIPAVVYKGLISNGEASLRETAVIFTYQNRVYKLQLTYVSNNENSDAEQVLQRIVAGFKLSPSY